MNSVTSIEQLDALYQSPLDRALWKEIDHLNEHYQRFIDASPFLILSTIGEQGIDCSPRGDSPGFVRIEDPKTLLIPDRTGNNRLDSLRNIVRDPRIGLIFLIPNAGETMRVKGRAGILVDEALCESFAVNGKPAISVLRVTVDRAYYQCQKAIARSGLWDGDRHVDRAELPTAGQMAKCFAQRNGTDFDGEAYDREYPEYMRENMY
jgi:PPOX class probable FMN-dependent enzyme